MAELKGAYSLVDMSPRKLIAVRDPFGFRPLCIGRLGRSVVFASESCALDAIGASFVPDKFSPVVGVARREGEYLSAETHQVFGLACKDDAAVSVIAVKQRTDADGVPVVSSWPS